MSFTPRNSPSRRRLLIDGRARIAVLVIGASVAGGGAGVVPALAGGLSEAASAACAAPGRTATTVLLDGQAITCEAAVTDVAPPPVEPVPPPDPPASTGGATDTEAPAFLVPPPPVEPPAADPEAVVPPAPPAADPAPAMPPAAAAGSEPESGPQVDVAASPASTADRTAAVPERAVAQGRTGHGREGVALGRHPRPRPAHVAPEASRGAGEARPEAAELRPRGRAARETDVAARAGETGDNGEAAKRSDAAAAATYAALPVSWTSLAPLALPVVGVDGFPIPPFLLPIYQAAAAQYGVPWEVLASINEIETDFGRNATVSSAGALGWMQFLRSSWSRWGTDADGDGRRDPRSPVDAIFAAARYLADAGAATDLPRAIFAYNHADWYVNRVVERARAFAGLDQALVAALSRRAIIEDGELYAARGSRPAGSSAAVPSAGQALLLTKRELTRVVLHSDEVAMNPGGRTDVGLGRVDRRVLATLVFLARSGMRPTVSCVITGHSLRTTRGTISAHSYGHAVDIAAINGVPISGHQGAGSVTAAALEQLVRLQGYGRPNQIISLMTVAGHDNTLSLADHDDHIHIGFARVARVPGAERPADIRRLAAAAAASSPVSPPA